MDTIEINGKKIGSVNSTYFIAEAGLNHNGDIDIAKKMIRQEASLSENLFAVYQGLVEAKLVPENELDLLGAWIKDVNNLLWN